jgi:hypothetical protein
MKKYRTGSGSIILKAICISLALFTGSSIFAAGVMASGGCGMKCCCQTFAPEMQPPEMRMQSSMGCCSGVQPNACDLQPAPVHKLPEIVQVVHCRAHLRAASGPAAIVPFFIGSRDCYGNLLLQPHDQIFAPPPLYLQNHSFLI